MEVWNFWVFKKKKKKNPKARKKDKNRSVNKNLVGDRSCQNPTMQRRHSAGITGRHQDYTRPPRQVQYAFVGVLALLGLRAAVCRRELSRLLSTAEVLEVGQQKLRLREAS